MHPIYAPKLQMKSDNLNASGLNAKKKQYTTLTNYSTIHLHNGHTKQHFSLSPIK